jgi:bifunctional non-homologous end joining protein LigD
VLARPPAGGIEFSGHIEADGATVFDHARRMGLQGIVSKQLDQPPGGRIGFREGSWILLGKP